MDENNNSWQQRLRNVKATEDEMPPFESAWKKAELKLGITKKRTYTRWYIAAAALLLMAFISLFIKRESPAVKDGTVLVRPALPHKSVSPSEYLSSKESLKTNKLSEGMVRHHNMKPAPYQPAQQDSNLNAVLQPTLTPDNTPAKLVVQAPVQKKKLQTIHVNELPEAAQPVQTTANNMNDLQPSLNTPENPEPPSHSIRLNNHN